MLMQQPWQAIDSTEVLEGIAIAMSHSKRVHLNLTSFTPNA